MSELKRLPCGMQTFELLRENNYLYVDKTDLIYKLVKEEKYVLFSRPRRFGKSLLLSTLKAYFEGKKEIFEGLKLSSLEKEWRKHPVLRFSLIGTIYNNEAGISNALASDLRDYEKLYSRDKLDEDLPSRFKTLIKNAYKQAGERVVILVDEYDKPFHSAKAYLSLRSFLAS